MKVKEGFMLREIAGSWIVVPIGERVVEFSGLLSLSESASLLWNRLEFGTDEDELVASLISEYDIDETTARTDVKEFIASLKEKGLLEQ